MNISSLYSDHSSNNRVSGDTQISHALTETFNADRSRNETFLLHNVLKLPEAKVIFLDKDYDRLIPSFAWDSDSHHNANAGYIEKDGLWGFIDHQGNETTPPRYIERPFYHITADVQDAATGKYGTIDTNGNIYNECKYDYITNGVYNVAKIGAKRGVVGKDDREILPFIYDDIYITQGREENPDELALALVRQGEMTYCIDAKTNQPVHLPEKRKQQERQFRGADGKYGCLTKEGYIIPAKFDILKTHVKEDKHLVLHEGLWKKLWIDKDGTMHMKILSEEIQQHAHAYYMTTASNRTPSDEPVEMKRQKSIVAGEDDETYAGVKIEGKRGIIDENTAEVVLPCKFDEIHLHYGSRTAWGRIKQWKALVEVSLPKKATP